MDGWMDSHYGSKLMQASVGTVFSNEVNLDLIIAYKDN